MMGTRLALALLAALCAGHALANSMLLGGVGPGAEATANYAMGSGYQPYADGTSYAHSSTVNANVSDMTTTADGSHIAPSNVYFGWSTSATQPPTSTAGMTAQNGGSYVNGGHNYWVVYSLATPSTPGTYYLWAVETNAAGAIVAAVVQATQPIGGGPPVAFTIT